LFFQVTQKLVETKKEESKNLKNEIHKEEKLKENLELIKNKINTIQTKNITESENSIHKEPTHEKELNKVNAHDSPQQASHHEEKIKEVRKIEMNKPEPPKENSFKELPKESLNANSDKITIKTNSTVSINKVESPPKSVTQIALDLGSLAAADDDSTGPGLNASFDTLPLQPKNRVSNKYSISLDSEFKKEEKNAMDENQKKEFQFFDQIQVSRFLELNSSTNNKNKLRKRLPIRHIKNPIHNVENQNLEELTQYEKLLKNKLDLITFENINKSRNIYQSLERFEDILQSLQNSRNTCESTLKKSISENMELKEALAELEIKFRLSRARKLN
jgi:hypothetical protein